MIFMKKVYAMVVIATMILTGTLGAYSKEAKADIRMNAMDRYASLDVSINTYNSKEKNNYFNVWNKTEKWSRTDDRGYLMAIKGDNNTSPEVYYTPAYGNFAFLGERGYLPGIAGKKSLIKDYSNRIAVPINTDNHRFYKNNNKYNYLQGADLYSQFLRHSAPYSAANLAKKYSKPFSFSENKIGFYNFWPDKVAVGVSTWNGGQSNMYTVGGSNYFDDSISQHGSETWSRQSTDNRGYLLYLKIGNSSMNRYYVKSGDKVVLARKGTVYINGKQAKRADINNWIK